jgi:hypothetical protein
LWKSIASQKYNGTNNFAIAPVLLGDLFPTTRNIEAGLVLCDVSEIVEFQTFSFGRIFLSESEKRHKKFLRCLEVHSPFFEIKIIKLVTYFT